MLQNLIASKNWYITKDLDLVIPMITYMHSRFKPFSFLTFWTFLEVYILIIKNLKLCPKI